MTAGWWAVLGVVLLAAVVAVTCFGWVAARWWRDRHPDQFEARARQALIDALTDPPPRRWQP